MGSPILEKGKVEGVLAYSGPLSDYNDDLVMIPSPTTSQAQSSIE